MYNTRIYEYTWGGGGGAILCELQRRDRANVFYLLHDYSASSAVLAIDNNHFIFKQTWLFDNCETKISKLVIKLFHKTN